MFSLTKRVIIIFDLVDEEHSSVYFSQRCREGITKDSSRRLNGLLKREKKEERKREREREKVGASYPSADLMAALMMPPYHWSYPIHLLKHDDMQHSNPKPVYFQDAHFRSSFVGAYSSKMIMII